MGWRGLTVAPERTHHLLNGAPAYSARFLEVLKFHDPGLAPAVDAAGATHIDLAGQPVYADRFVRTFGFYEGRAAVHSLVGWFHILPDGSALSCLRFAWCGNFQEARCAVRNVEGRYLHLGVDGLPAYEKSWRYVGDYRDGVAVVQRDDGLHTHIDKSGSHVHLKWFVDLDVFHKGYARARDDVGWMHVDGAGLALYERRFANVEPFYNGQARVERFDGGLEVIDEHGDTVVELRGGRRSEFAALSADMVGFWRTEAIAAAVELGIFEAMPGTTADIAGRLGLDHGRLNALLRALVELSLVDKRGTIWARTARGEYLAKDNPLTLADAAGEYAGPLRKLWGSLTVALRDTDWRTPDVFSDVAADPLRVQSHHRMLRSYARHDYPSVPKAMQLRGDELVMDVGGGLGVLAEMLLDEYPKLRVILLDRTEVIAQARANPNERLQLLSGDLFERWDVKVDVVVLARVLHDWDDERAARILANARKVLPVGGRVFVVEMLIPDDGAFGGLCDLHLLMATGGRERTAKEFENLLRQAGFEPTAVQTLAALPSIIEGVAR